MHDDEEKKDGEEKEVGQVGIHNKEDIYDYVE